MGKLALEYACDGHQRFDNTNQFQFQWMDFRHHKVVKLNRETKNIFHPLRTSPVAKSLIEHHGSPPEDNTAVWLRNLRTSEIPTHWVNITNLFNESLVDRIAANASAESLMTTSERRMYEQAPRVFNEIANELLNELLGELSSRATAGLKRELTEWLRLMIVRVSNHMEDV